MARHGIVGLWYGMAWYGRDMVWHGYGMAWYGKGIV